MKKQVVTLNIGNYLTELTKLTYPCQQAWADKIGATWFEITERKWPDHPIANYEKFQLYDIAQEADWTYFLDCDAFIHPDSPDWAEHVDKSYVIFNGVDNRLNRFRASNYSRRSHSNIGACSWFVICSNWCYDLWTPPENWEQSVKNITLQWTEAKSGHCTRDHLIDDYTLSENIARFNLHTITITDICNSIGHQNNYCTHLYNCRPEEKLTAIRHRLDEMGVSH